MENPTSTLRVPGRTQETAINATPLALEEVVNDVVHRVTNEAVTKYKKLIEDPLLCTRDVVKSNVQGFGETEETDTMRFLDLKESRIFPKTE